MTRRYYVIAGVLIQKPLRQWRRLVDPDDPCAGAPYTLLKLGTRGSLRVVFSGGPAGNLLVAGLDQKVATEAVDAVEGYVALRTGWIREDTHFPPAYALLHTPKRAWTDDRLLTELQLVDPDVSEIQVRQIRSGITLADDQQHYLQQYVPRIFANPNVRESMRYFRESRRIFDGHMTGSYYQVHYQTQRRSMRSKQLEQKYRNYRPLYESAFAAAFKAIERLLGTNQVRKSAIPKLLEGLNRDALAPTAVYIRDHEIFRELARSSTYSDMTGHFLDIRNVVVAHANSSPPSKFSISEDNVFEIQRFVGSMYYALLGEVETYTPPSYSSRTGPRGV